MARKSEPGNRERQWKGRGLAAPALSHFLQARFCRNPARAEHGTRQLPAPCRRIIAPPDRAQEITRWEPNAPDRRAAAQAGDPAKGLVIFSSTCFICHGENGQSTDRAPALNDPARLAQFDDKWYTDTITPGRPAKGMPTWGTVLSPRQTRDLVALLRAWQRGETVTLPAP